MKRKKWYKYKNNETGHVIYSPLKPVEMTICEGETYYSDEIHLRSRLTRRERKRLHVYRSRKGHVAKSKTDGMCLSLDLFDEGGEYSDSLPMEMTR